MRGVQRLKGEIVISVHSDWWPVLVAFAFAVCLAVRGFSSMVTDRTTKGAAPGYVRPDYRGSTATSVGAIIALAMAWVAPWFVETFFVEFLNFEGDLLSMLGFVHASVSVVLALKGVYVKYLAKDSIDDWAYSGDGERTVKSVVYTVAGAVFGCVAASVFAVA